MCDPLESYMPQGKELGEKVTANPGELSER